jgi:hypothetical protein
VDARVIVEHLGKLHGYEHALVLLLAFGPVLLLAVTIWIARRRAEED